MSRQKKKPLVIHEFNIAEEDNVVLLQKLFSIYGVASDKQQVPIVFFSGGYKFLGENPGACPWDEAKKYFFNPYHRYFLNI